MMELSAMTFYWLMFALCLPIFVFQLKLSMFPQAKGSITGFDSVAICLGKCGDIKDMKDTVIDTSDLKEKTGRLSVGVKVMLDSGEEIEAITSPCTICMERFRIGTRVAINKINGKYQVHPLIWRN